jgi:adenosylcobalamin-dependent ribonucleoside-triphosphate reductase
MLSFKLSDAFIDRYNQTPVPWGFRDAAGNSVGELVFLRTYSRLKEDGTKETWQEVCRRVIEGTMSIQKDHAKANRLPWSDRKAAATAQEMYDRMFHFKWLPPGRGLWVMGTPLVNEQRNSAALQNCAFVSTSSMTFPDPAAPFAFLMEASMLGIGVGFDTLGADKGFKVYTPGPGTVDHVIGDTREEWVASVVALLESYLLKGGRPAPDFDYDQIRKAGEPIRTFGGTAAGPEPLRQLHEKLRIVLDRYVAVPGFREARTLDSTGILDIGNLIGVCVVSGNVRRSAELALGSLDDPAFLEAKNYGRTVMETQTIQVFRDVATGEVVQDDDGGFPEKLKSGEWEVSEERREVPIWEPSANAYRAEWGWMSNNSIVANVGDDLSAIAEGIRRNGEPGVIWLDLSRAYGRLVDAPTNADHRVMGYNPCAEQSLESFECCTLVETFLGRHESLEDYLRTLKFSYLYAKTVTLLPTHWERTNAIMARNRRIGTSMSGLANFADRHGIAELRRWMEAGYDTVQGWDRLYSEWLCVRESIKTTTIKPSGTVSILAGESPGAHWQPGGKFFRRRVIFSKDDPAVTFYRWAGYEVEESAYTPETSVVVSFYIRSDAERSEKDVAVFEKVHMAALAQRYWSDNSVSVTASFDPDTEGQHIETVLAMYEGQLKTLSMLPMATGTYAQMPYEEITAEEYEAATLRMLPVDLAPVYAGQAADAVGEAYCTTDACEVKEIKANA